MKKIIGIFLLFVFSIMLTACGTKNSNEQTEIYISGSSSVAPIIIKLADIFEKNYPKYKVVVDISDSTLGIFDTRNNKNHIGMSSRSFTEEERKGVESFLLCRDAIAIIVNKDCTLDKINKEQLYALYMQNTTVGEITHAISREDESGTHWAFVELTGIGKGELLPETVEILDNTSQVKEAIIDDATKLGYISLGSLSDRVKALSYSDGGDYIIPSAENMANASYPLYRPFYLVIPKGTLVGTTQMFIDFCRSQKAKEIMLENGLIPLI